MSEIFISYSHEDRARVESVVELLRKQDWEVRWDQDFHGGTNFYEKLGEVLTAVRCMVVVWTSSSIESEWVGREATEGAQRKMLVPVRLDEVKIPIGFRDILTIQLTGWAGDEDHPQARQLIDSVARTLARPRYSAARKLTAAVLALLLVAAVGILVSQSVSNHDEAHLLQLVPDWPLARLLPEDPDPEAQKYELILEFDDQERKLEDLRFGVVYAGAEDREDLRRRIEELPYDELRSVLDRYLARFIPEEVPRRNRVDDLLSNAQFLPTPRLERGDELRAKIVCAGEQIVLAEHSFTIVGSAKVQSEYLEGSHDRDNFCHVLPK